MRDRLIVSNPAAGAELPRQERREMSALDRPQLARLLAASEATGNRWHARWCVLATGGEGDVGAYGHALSGQDGDAAAKVETYWAAGV